MLWAVQRTDDKDEANLQLSYPKLEVDASVNLPSGKKVKLDASPLADLVPPMLTNPATIKEHVRLIALNDLNLQNIEKEKDRKRREEKENKQAEARAKAKAKA